MNKQPNLISPDRPVRSEFTRQDGLSYATRRVLTISLLLVLLVVGGLWLWSVFTSFSPRDIPTIRADGSYKERPDEPGGIDIPHQDVRVYREIDGSSAHGTALPTVEHILPPAEAPIVDAAAPSASVSPDMVPAPAPIPTGQLESLMSSTPPDENPIPVATTEAVFAQPPQTDPTVAAEMAREIMSAPDPVPTPAPIPTPAEDVAPAAPVIETPKPVAAPKPKKTPPVASPQSAPKVAKAAPIAAGMAAVQLASSPNEAAARSKLHELKSRFQSALGGAELRLLRADLGAKGVFHRIQSLPMPEADALATCSAIKNSGGDCILVRR